jgi:hypothetical protein
MKSQLTLKRSFYPQLLFMVPTITLLGLAGRTGTNWPGNESDCQLAHGDG